MNNRTNIFKEAVLLWRSIPGIVTVFFLLSVVAMNLLANKSIALPVDWLALDCGIIFSWLAFLVMDMVTKHFGPRAAILLSFIALIVNLFMAVMFLAASFIPGEWGESFDESGTSSTVINYALDHTFRGTWYVLLGSSVAFIASSVINNELNWLIGRASGDNAKGGFGKFVLRSYVSTFVGQFADNLIFAFMVSRIFFGWTTTQCLMCALTGAVAELLCEIVFSPIGYRVAKNWEDNNVGEKYMIYLKEAGGKK